ncbi:UNVERIFIED_ORG: 8-oxo-dGTP pyrophosphatase MutT (NUDIX family) [Xanthobacter viscosus]|uniref:NUDIX hydrolase n=1 Tax=Xanthobacter autotrophicus TaxID=280 RepID=UPI001AEF1017|nr:NUDIX hydrolase [Xanthobacter autotrophicus]
MSPSPVWPELPVATGGPSGRRVQYAALPYRVRRDGEVQIRLITSRETRRWVIPKGWPMKGLSPPKAAAREAYEEAGLVGVISREPLGMYTYEKRLGTRSVLCDVLVFPFKVKRLLQKWPERFQRYGFWFSIDSAAAAVQEEDLSELIRSFGEIMARRWEAERLEAQQAKASKEKPGAAPAGDELPDADRQAKGKPAKMKAAKGKPDKARPDLVAQPADDADEIAAPAFQATGKGKPEKIKLEKGKPDKTRPAKVKAEKANLAKGVKAKSEKAARARAGMDGGELVGEVPAGAEPGHESEATAKKAAKGKGGKAARKGESTALPPVSDAPPAATEAGHDGAKAGFKGAPAKVADGPVAGDLVPEGLVRKVAAVKKPELPVKAAGVPPRKALAAKKVPVVKKGAAVRKAAPAKTQAKIQAKTQVKGLTKGPTKRAAKGLASEGAKGVSKGTPTGRRKAKVPGPSEKPRA